MDTMIYIPLAQAVLREVQKGIDGIGPAKELKGSVEYSLPRSSIPDWQRILTGGIFAIAGSLIRWLPA